MIGIISITSMMIVMPMITWEAQLNQLQEL